MQRLGQKHPETVNINGLIIPINTNFTFALEADAILNSAKLKRDKPLQTLRLLYAMYDICDNHDDEPEPERLQAFQELFIEEIGEENISEAVMQALWFLRCGEIPDERKSHEAQLIDFSHDAKYIESALLRKGIDLQSIDYMHFWKFCSHISELPDGVTIGRLAYLRDRDNKGKTTADEKAEILRYGKAFHIKNEEQEKIKDYWNARLPD